MDEAEEWMKISEKLAEWIFLSLIVENFDRKFMHGYHHLSTSMMLGLLKKNHMSGRFLDLLPLLQLVKGGCLGDFGCFPHGRASGLLGWSGKMETNIWKPKMRVWKMIFLFKQVIFQVPCQFCRV